MQINPGFSRSTLVASIVLCGLAGAARTSRATDAFNLKAPSAVETDVNNNPLIFANSPTRPLTCYIRLNGTSWTCFNNFPHGGNFSGPSATVMPDVNNPAGPVKYTFVFVIGHDAANHNAIWTNYMPAGGAWSNWDTGTLPLGAPANITSAVTAGHGRFAFSVAVRDNSNVFWELLANSDLSNGFPHFTSWGAAASDGSSSAPAPAVNDNDEYLFGLGAGNFVRWSVCGFPTCFASWDTVNTKTFNESPAAYTFYDSSFNPKANIAATSGGHVWVGTEDVSARTFGGFTDLGSASGTAADSAPTIVDYAGTQAVVVVHANNGKYEWRNTMSGSAWAFLPVLN